jgi:hypothetical protein
MCNVYYELWKNKKWDCYFTAAVSTKNLIMKATVSSMVIHTLILLIILLKENPALSAAQDAEFETQGRLNDAHEESEFDAKIDKGLQLLKETHFGVLKLQWFC